MGCQAWVPKSGTVGNEGSREGCGWLRGHGFHSPPPRHRLLAHRRGVTDPGLQRFRVKDQSLARSVDSRASGANHGAGEGRGVEALFRNAGSFGGERAGPRGRWERRGQGSVPSLARAPRGSGAQSSSSSSAGGSPSPRDQRRSMAPGRDLGPRPGRQCQVPRDWGEPGRPGGGGVRARGGVPASPGSPS